VEKSCLLTLAVISLALTTGGVSAQEMALEYPNYLLDAYDADNNGCWMGMDANGVWPVPVVPQQWLVGRPPTFEVSGVTVPVDHWVELKFPGKIVDGPGDDILLTELDAVAEQALVFITDGSGSRMSQAGSGQEYLLGLAAVPDIDGYGPTRVGFDIAGLSLPFVPSAVRVLGIDLRGGSPGFDLAYVRARTHTDCGWIACNPNPVDGAKNVPTNVVLSWSPGYSAEKHTFHFGTALSDVDSSVQPQDANSFDPSGLELGKTYYWRVDEVNSTDANSPWIGDLWRFTVADYLVVDDFESYDGSTLYDKWIQIDQAYMYLSKGSKPFHKCRQSMAFRYYYDNLFYSEVTYPFSSAQDWVSAGVKALEMFFRGQADNDPNTLMYFVLGDGNVETVVPYDGDANDITKETWQPWRIDLQNIPDVNLSNVESIYIGFTDVTSQPLVMGLGTVYFDDIRLYSSRCLEENRPNADFNGDCAVGFEDLEEMAYSWLDKRPNVYPVAAPNAPVAWYKFDGNAYDSAGSAHGQLRGSPTYVPGVFGRAISFDGYKDSVEITGAAALFRKVTNAVTIAFWQLGVDSQHLDDTLCCSNYTYGLDNPAIAINLGCWRQPGRYNWDCGSPWSFNGRLSGNHRYKSEWSGRWNHWAFTKDIRSGKMQIFLNGILYDSRTDAHSPISRITSFEIGSGWYGGYDGLIDDFRIYDYALSQSEIAYVATNGTGIFDLPLMSPADLNNDGQINFKDFTILATSWLEEQLWP